MTLSAAENEAFDVDGEDEIERISVGLEKPEEFLRTWISPSQRVEMRCAESGDRTCVLVRFLRDDSLIHEMLLSPKWIDRHYPGVRPVTDALTGRMKGKEHVCNEAWFEKRDSFCGITWDERLYTDAVPPRGAIYFCLGYAMAKGGRARISILEEQMAEDFIFEGEVFSNASVIWVDSEYQDEKTRSGWGESIMVQMEQEVLLAA